MKSFRFPVDEIREQCDLVEIISAYVALKRSGQALKGLCPFHNEKTPSFTVNADIKRWKCFGCGEQGDVFSFVQKIDNLTFAEAAEMLAKKAGIEIERTEKAAQEYSERERLLRANNIACSFYRSMLQISAKTQEYLAKRGLTASTVEKYKLGYAPDDWQSLYNHLMQQRVSPADAVKAGLIVPRENSQGFYDRFRDRLMFPILDTMERVIAFGGRVMGEGEPKYLNSPETPLFLKNKTLYGLNIARRAISNDDKLLVVEGYMDVIATQEAGFGNTVATLGTALTPEHVNKIARFTTNVVLCFDADSAGINAALKSAPVFEQAGFNVRIINMPKGEDPDSMLRGGDTSRFATLVEKSLPIPDYRIKLALSKYDMRTDEGKTAALKDSVAILAGIESTVERERLVKLLARFHPNFSTGTTLAEDHIRKEVNRLGARLQRGNTIRPSREQAIESKNIENKPLSFVERSEKLLLGIIIFHQAHASKVFSILSPNEFTGEDTQTLASILNRLYTELGKIDQEELRNRVAGTSAENLLMDLLLGQNESELKHPIDELIKVIVNHKKNERRLRLRALAMRIQEGTVKHGDEEYEEYLRLVKETSSPFRR